MHSKLSRRQQALAADNRAVVWAVIRDPKYRNFAAYLGPDEAEAVGLLELVKRARTLDPRKGLRFGTYAFQAIGTALRRAATSRQRQMPRGGPGSEVVLAAPAREFAPDVQASLREELARPRPRYSPPLRVPRKRPKLKPRRIVLDTSPEKKERLEAVFEKVVASLKAGRPLPKQTPSRNEPQNKARLAAFFDGLVRSLKRGAPP